MNLSYVVNWHLPTLAKLSEEDFLVRVCNVRAIRTSGLPISLFIRDKEGWHLLERLHEAVHTDSAQPLEQEKSKRKVFVVEIPQPLHEWLRQNTLANVRSQIVNWMGALYAADHRRFQMWSKLLPEIKQCAKSQYTGYSRKPPDNLQDIRAAEFERAGTSIGGRCPEVLLNPFLNTERPFIEDPEVRASINFQGRLGYFTEEDWLTVVEQDRKKVVARYQSNLDSGAYSQRTIDQIMKHGETDDMSRAESKYDLWQAWLAIFSVGRVSVT